MSPVDRDGRPGQGEPGDDAGADAARDAWLREALRHAPDAAAAPPPALREAILAQARAATRAPSPRRARAASSGSAFWAWLARPAVASGFAGVMAATLVGLMWWDQPMDLALPPPNASTAPTAPTAPVTAQVEPAPAAAAPAAAVPTPLPSDQLDPRVADLSRAKEQRVAQQATRAGAGSTANDARTAAKSRRADAEPKPFAGDTPAAVAPAAPAAPAATAAAEAPATPAAPAPTTAAPAAPQAAPLRERQGLATGAARSKAAPEAFATAPPLAGRGGDRSEPRESASRDAAPDALRSAARTSDTSRPLETLLASVTADPSRWSRRAAGGEARPLDEAAQRWVADFDAATRNRWQGALAGAGAAADAGPASAAAPSLVLLLDGRPAAVFRVDGADAFYEARLAGPARQWRAALGAAEAARLAATLPR